MKKKKIRKHKVRKDNTVTNDNTVLTQTTNNEFSCWLISCYIKIITHKTE